MTTDNPTTEAPEEEPGDAARAGNAAAAPQVENAPGSQPQGELAPSQAATPTSASTEGVISSTVSTPFVPPVSPPVDSREPVVPAVAEAPRTRWGGIIWGLVFLALAGVGFWSTTVLSADFLADIWLRITPLAVGAGMVLIVGAIALLCALVALARHLQRRSAAQRSPF
ncbi:hypothetical protein [Microbacterium gorillae]|uniref:hypothetical protein n=1 Tax=Microbacterium gorillae TaxID=1231063 RepID=UPI003D99E0C4